MGELSASEIDYLKIELDRFQPSCFASVRRLSQKMASKRNSTKIPSLATQSRAKKQLFLPMAAEKAEELALRFRIAFNVAARAQATAAEARVLMQTIMMAGLIADIEPSPLDDRDLAACEAFMAERIASGKYSAWGISESEEQALRAVINEHDRQLRQARLQTIVLATERFDRLANTVDAAQKMFAARRSENSRKASG